MQKINVRMIVVVVQYEASSRCLVGVTDDDVTMSKIMMSNALTYGTT